MEALFACAKCHTRHPFEELSAAEQFCKVCQKHSDMVRCIYCRVEFQAEDKNGISPVCKNCSHCLKTYGKPKACEYCKEIAAFVGKKCQRCSHQEKKYGSPKLCERCKNMCAFDRGEDYRGTMEGKMLCWLCIVAYKRANKKQQKLEYLGNNTRYSPLGTNNSTPVLLSGEKKSLKDSSLSTNGTPNMATKDSESVELKFPDFLRSKDDSLSKTLSPIKRKLEKTSSTSKKGRFEFGLESGEHLTTITQLREDIESYKKQLNAKDQVILQKDQKITELKAKLFELDKETRSKIQQVQKHNNEIIDNLQVSVLTNYTSNLLLLLLSLIIMTDSKYDNDNTTNTIITISITTTTSTTSITANDGDDDDDDDKLQTKMRELQKTANSMTNKSGKKAPVK